MPHAWLQNLTIDAALGELPSHEFILPAGAPGSRVAAEFERRPDLPGIIVSSSSDAIEAMISRGAFFQRLSRPFSREVYLNRPLRIFLDEPLPRPLCLPANHAIGAAAVLALDRAIEHAYEPLVVIGTDGNPRLLDVYVLLRAQAHLLGVAQAAMLQNEKLASLGQLAAGMAHEINNPLAFVSNDLAVIERDARALATAIVLFRQCEPAIATLSPELSTQICELHDRVDLTYTAENLPALAKRSREGLRRIADIIRDLREFARLDLGDESEVDLNGTIASTANMLAGRAAAADVTIDLKLAPVPAIPGNPGKISQLILNLMNNAVDACQRRGQVRVRSTRVQEAASIEIEDNGKGIDPAIANRVFDPFFTTKPPGHGTGLGLTVSYAVVREHRGLIDFVTCPGKGTTFRVLLPLNRP